MCRFMSAIVTRDKILWDLDMDSHEDIVKKFNLDDTTKKPNFVRVELLPRDGDIFNHDLKNWVLQKDQDLIPGWFDIEASEKKVKKALSEVFANRFVISREIPEIDKGRWFFKNGKVGVLKGSSVVKYMRGSSVVQYMWDSSVVQYMRDSSVVQYMRGSSVVLYMWDSSVVQAMWDSSVVQYMWDSSVVQAMRGSSVVQAMRGSSVVQYMWDSSVVQDMWDSSVVQDMRGSSVVLYMWDSSVAISRVKNKIITPNKDFKLEYFEKESGK
jgi:hypothetical protein